MNETALYILLAYYIGMAVAYAIAYGSIKRSNSNDNPWFAASLGWVFVFAALGVYVVELFRKGKV